MIQKTKNKKLNIAGFTLIELIIVIAILGLLAAIAIPRLGSLGMSAKNRVDEANAQLLTKIAQTINANEGSFPATLNDLNKAGDYLNEKIELQNSDNTFTYDNSNGIVSVIKSGGDDVESSDATLRSLTISAGTLSPAFSSEITSYTVLLPMGTTIPPTISTIPNNAEADVNITDASGLPGTATVVVTSEDGSATRTYTVSFSVRLNSGALLQSLSTSTGALSPAFDSSVTAYTVTLPSGTTTVPTVSAIGKDGATITSITQADTPNGTATVNVRSADGSETNSYTVTFTVLAPSQPNPPQIRHNGNHITVSGAETGALLKLYKDDSVIKQQQLTGSDTSHMFDHITKDNPGTYFATQTVNGMESTPSNTITISAPPLVAQSVSGSTNQFTVTFNKNINSIVTMPDVPFAQYSHVNGNDVTITGHSNYDQNKVYSITVKDKDGLQTTVNFKRISASSWSIQ